MNMNLDHSKEPDWSDSRTAELELWKNPYFHMNDRLEMADGAVAWRNDLIKKLRAELAAAQVQTPVEKLGEQMQDLGINNLHVFPGTNPDVTADEVAAEVSKSLDRLAAGDYEDVTDEVNTPECRVEALAEQLYAYVFCPEPIKPKWVPNGNSQMQDKVRDMARKALKAIAPGPEALPETQEPKYGVRDGLLYNRQSGKVIPTDEPVFIFRASDKLAEDAIREYMSKLTGEHREAVEKRVVSFVEFRKAKPHRMKCPDTQMTEPN